MDAYSKGGPVKDHLSPPKSGEETEKDYGLEMKYIVLKLLNKTAMHGYMLATEIEKEFGKKPSNGTLNPLFNKLENDGLIDAFETVEHGKYKKIYSLSSKGKAILEKITTQIKRFVNY